MEIAPWAFEGCKNVKSVYVPLTVTKIGAGAFSGCSSLEEMTLPFVGGDLFAEKKSEETVFGHIFGKTKCQGFVPAVQGFRPVVEDHFEDYKVPDTVTYYVPESLWKVTVTGGEPFLRGVQRMQPSHRRLNLGEVGDYRQVRLLEVQGS